MQKTLTTAISWGLALMALGTACFVSVPEQMLRVFTNDALVIEIGRVGFRFVGISFLPMVTSLIFPVFFQAVGYSLKSSALTVIRTVALFVPLGYVFSRFGLNWFWLTFPVTETITSVFGLIFYRGFLEADYVRNRKPEYPVLGEKPALQPSKPGVIITIARQHGSSGKQIGKLVAQRLGIPFYYKEMIALAAHESGLDAEFISDIHKNAPDVLRELYLSTGAVRYAIDAQKKIIRRIADNGSCVIVGRAAGYVLRDYENVVRVFVHAPKKYRIQRVMEIYGDTPEEAKRNIRRSDKARSAYYHHISGKHWSDSKNYDLVLDSSAGIEKAVDAIVNFVSEK
ncbi:MAG: cytidylate kinase family protein [Oscillospiraceae bacterium]|nr:cytidylate kinase family protein [Oscillospiraceae bacterium]